MLQSCAPVNNINNKIVDKAFDENTTFQEKIIKEENFEKNDIFDTKNIKNYTTEYSDKVFQNEITVILYKNDNKEIVKQFLNILEMVIYQKKIKNISFSIKIYEDGDHLIEILNNENLDGKMFIGPLNSNDTKILANYCSEGPIFFSFSSKTDLGKDCIFLINFFPENEIQAIFDFFPDNSKIALLYPEDEYGYHINRIIDSVADNSSSIIVNRASYNANLSNAPQAIKELGKYELRKYELNRQKRILATKKDEESKKRLKKLERFQTTKDFDFTHIIIADYGLRLLQVAPLLPYYDIDPNIIQFVGTGAWDDSVFYDEPSLEGSIYPGIEYKNRKNLIDDYQELYKQKLLRISTLPYDLTGLLIYLINNNYSVTTFHKMIESKSLKFSGIDGSFSFNNNLIQRDLEILQINNGNVSIISK